MYFLNLSMTLWIPDAVLQPNTHRSSTFCNTSSIACAPANKSHFIALNKHNEYDQSLIFVCKQYNVDINSTFITKNHTCYIRPIIPIIWTLRGLPCLFWVSLSSKCSDLPLWQNSRLPHSTSSGARYSVASLSDPSISRVDVIHSDGDPHVTFRSQDRG